MGKNGEASRALAALALAGPFFIYVYVFPLAWYWFSSFSLSLFSVLLAVLVLVCSLFNLPVPAPTGKPVTTIAHNTSATSVYISWKAPPPESILGEFLGYRITYRPRDYHTDDVKEIYIRDSTVEVRFSGTTKFDLPRVAVGLAPAGRPSSPYDMIVAGGHGKGAKWVWNAEWCSWHCQLPCKFGVGFGVEKVNCFFFFVGYGPVVTHATMKCSWDDGQLQQVGYWLVD